LSFRRARGRQNPAGLPTGTPYDHRHDQQAVDGSGSGEFCAGMQQFQKPDRGHSPALVVSTASAMSTPRTPQS